MAPRFKSSVLYATGAYSHAMTPPDGKTCFSAFFRDILLSHLIISLIINTHVSYIDSRICLFKIQTAYILWVDFVLSAAAHPEFPPKPALLCCLNSTFELKTISWSHTTMSLRYRIDKEPITLRSVTFGNLGILWLCSLMIRFYLDINGENITDNSDHAHAALIKSWQFRLPRFPCQDKIIWAKNKDKVMLKTFNINSHL